MIDYGVTMGFTKIWYDRLWFNDGPSPKFDMIDYGVTICLQKNLM